MSEHFDEGTIHAWLDGQLSPEESARIEAHIAGCGECSALVADARGYMAAASRIVGALDAVPANVVPARRRGIRPWQLRIAAAVVVMVLGTAVFLREPAFNNARLSSAPASYGVANADSAQGAKILEQAQGARPAVPYTSPSATTQSASAPPLPSPTATPGVAGAPVEPQARRMSAAKARAEEGAADRSTNAAVPAMAAPAVPLAPRATSANEMVSGGAPAVEGGQFVSKAEAKTASDSRATRGLADSFPKAPQRLDVVTGVVDGVDLKADSTRMRSVLATVTFPRASVGAASGPSACTGLVVSIATHGAADSAVGQTITVRLGSPLHVASESQDTAAFRDQVRSGIQLQSAPVAISQTGSWIPLGPDSAIVVVAGSGAPQQARVSCRPR
jgi:hypothetical protein